MECLDCILRYLVGRIGIVIVHKFNNFINDATNVIVLKEGEVVGREHMPTYSKYLRNMNNFII